jgi:hypothetical protein
VHLKILKATPCNRRCLSVATARDDADPFLTGDPKMLVSHGAMILVIDGAKMSLLRNRGKDFAVDLELVEHGAKQAASTAEMGTDKPGRSFASAGRTRSAYQATDYHQAEEDDFDRRTACPGRDASPLQPPPPQPIDRRNQQGLCRAAHRRCCRTPPQP